MEDLVKITRDHGRQMYQLGLEHAINTIELAGDAALDMLKEKLAKERAENDN